MSVVEILPDGMMVISVTEDQFLELQKRLEEPARELPRLREMLQAAEVWREAE